MAESRRFPAKWLAIYREDNRRYVSGSSRIQVGGSEGFNTFLGFDSSLKEAINSSSIAVTVKLFMTVTNAGEFDVGMHREKRNKASNGLPFYRYAGFAPRLENGKRSINITNLRGGIGTSFKNAINGDYEGVILYGARNNYGVAHGITNNENEVYIEVTGEWSPKAPQNLKPSTGNRFDLSQNITLSWSHNEGSGGQSKFSLEWRKQGDSAWKTITLNSPNQSYTFSGNTFPKGNIQWRVRTWNQSGLVSPWSAYEVFYAASPSNAPTFIYPEDGTVISDSKPIYRWSSVDQSAYDIRLYDGSSLIWSEERVTSDNFVSHELSLENLGIYEARLRIRNNDGLWSDDTVVNFSTSFTPPNPASIGVSLDNDNGSIRLDIENPEGGENVPSASYNRVYRRKKGEYDWVLIADAIPSNYYFVDYTPASNETYEYMVRAFGYNGTFSDSEIIEAQITIRDVLLSLANDLGIYIRLKYNSSRSYTVGVGRELMQFSGRSFPVAEYDSSQSLEMSFSYMIRGFEELNKLISMIESRQIFLYRDYKGRKEYISIPDISIKDHPQIDKYDISLSPVKVDYQEGVLE